MVCHVFAAHSELCHYHHHCFITMKTAGCSLNLKNRTGGLTGHTGGLPVARSHVDCR